MEEYYTKLGLYKPTKLNDFENTLFIAGCKIFTKF